MIRGDSGSLILGEQITQGFESVKDEVGPRNLGTQIEIATINPSYSEAQGLSAYHIGELRLPGVQYLLNCYPRMIQKISKESAVRLVTVRSLGCADKVELST